MNILNSNNLSKDYLSDFSNDGEMGALIAAKDWSNTPLGPIEKWPDTLKSYLKLMLGSKYQMWLWWGPEYYNFYNDAYAPTLGIKHPESLGKSSKIIWSEIWDVIGPMVDNVRTTGKSLYYENLVLFLERSGFKEETYHTFSYSALPDGLGSIGGVFCAVSEDTKKVLSERRLYTLHDLSDSNTKAKNEDEVCRESTQALKKNANDIPFAFLYLLDKDHKNAYLKGQISAQDTDLSPQIIHLDSKEQDIWAFSEVLKSKGPLLFNDLSKLKVIPKGPWEENPTKAMVLPMFRSGNDQVSGFLITGLSSRLVFDEEYKNFLSLVALQIATSLSNVRALEEERKRAEALAEIDKAKTVFFSNVSHEFRTPLTLMLGPLHEMVNKDIFKNEQGREHVNIVYRNSLRLLRLVNTLLDFSRLEAGRVHALYRETDISKFTAYLSSSFSSAIESAGLQFNIDCNPVLDPVYVDHTMWERVVFNLLSNALKFTFQGHISVSIQQKEHQVELRVEDTGTGIPEEELPKLFTRFHRIENSKGRTHEGSGIGLAMVNELVKMHGGTIDVESNYGKGTTFIVKIPTGKAHLPHDRIAAADSKNSITLNAIPDLNEELSNYDFDSSEKPLYVPSSENHDYHSKKRDKILIADDNADMREYLSKLLKDYYEVITVHDGLEALKMISKENPSLILSDVMMPNLDGLGLVREIRSNISTSTLPIILISARAGEEATIEGIQTGADDYLIKPFSAKELISRVASNLKIAKTRLYVEKNLQNIFKQADVAMTILKGDSFIVEMANPRALEIWGKSEGQVLNKSIVEVLPEIREQGFEQLLNQVYTSGQRFVGNEVAVELIKYGKLEIVYLNFIYDVLRDPDEKIIGIMALGYDVTEIVKAKKSAEKIAADLAEANKDVINKNEELTKINNDLDNFIYTASHDLKAPVANIEGLLETMVESLSEESRNSQDFKTIFELIEKSITRFKNTILDLTEISKAQKFENEDFTEINCEEIIEDVKLTIQNQIHEAEANINVNLECKILNFSRKNFKSIVYNLMSNAIKYRSPQRKIHINISTRKEAGFIVLTVQDNGLGISEANKGKLFSMFKRFHDHVEGTGIGLYIVKRIVDNAGGKIEIETDVNKGSTFKVYIPD